MSGHFITLEGGEGVGKTTLIDALQEDLICLGYDVITTREPGGVEISEQIRNIILSPSHTKMDGRTEALLYAAARRQHLIEVVLPALKKGKVILCDRFIDSSLAYQGHARGLGIEEVLSINEFAIQTCMPQLTLFLDLDPRKGLERILSNEHREKNRLDLEDVPFHELVHEGYKLLLTRYPERIKKINADQRKEKVRKDALEQISYYFEQNK